MIDQHQRLNTLVKDELAKSAVALGVDKSQLGHWVGPMFTPQDAGNGQIGIMFSWVAVITLRVPLLGYPALNVPVIIPAAPGAMPTDEDFRGAAKMGLGQLAKAYTELMADAEKSAKGLGEFAA